MSPSKLPAFSHLSTLSYFNRFDYPLTPEDLFSWQEKTFKSQAQINQELKTSLSLSQTSISGHYYFLPQRRHLIKLRKQREIWSQSKWSIAKKVGESLSQIPTIQAIFVTGSLAMNNSDPNDDIDFMIVTFPNTLWFTRAVVVLLLKFKRLRRNPGLPEHSSSRVADKICDNLYFDANNLKLANMSSPSPKVTFLRKFTQFLTKETMSRRKGMVRDEYVDSVQGKTNNHGLKWTTIGSKKSVTEESLMYLAHEILQAKCIFDRGGIHHKFLEANSWASRYLPVAYKSQISNLKSQTKSKDSHPNVIINFTFYILNLCFFLVQFLYMKPKMKTEKIGPGFAFFHPNSQV